MKIKKEHLTIVFILLFGLVLRILKFDDTVIGTDIVVFSRLGKNLVENLNYVFGENYNFGIFFPPAFPVLVGLVNLFTKNLFFSAQLVSLVSSLITIFVFYLIGKELYNEESGLFAAFAYSAYPLLLILSVYGSSDTLFFCFMFFSIYLFIVSIKKDSFLYYFLLGISFALAYLTRPEGILLLLLPFLHLFGFWGSKPTINKRHMIKIIIMVSVFIVFISPYVLFLKKNTGEFTLSGKTNEIILLGEMSEEREYHEIMNAPGNPYDKAAYSLNEDKNQLIGWDKNKSLTLKKYIFKDPVNFIGKYQKRVLQEIKMLSKLLFPILLPIVFVFFSKDLVKRRIRLIFVILPVLYLLIYPLFLVVERHVFLGVLFIILFSAGGFANSSSAFFKIKDFYQIRNSHVISFLGKNIQYIIIILFIASSISYLRFTSYDKIPVPVEHIKAGNFIKKNISSGYEHLNIMSKRPIVSFYSDSRFTMIPYANSSDVINFAILHNVDYIVVSERLLGEWEFYDELKQMDKHSEDVALAYEDNSGELIRLFKVLY